MIKQYDFEARYVDVKWQNRETLDSFESAITSIPIESSLEDGLFIETEAFRNYQPRIGFRILSDQLLHTPYFIADNDTIEELMPIKDMATGNTWWIQSGKWNNKEKRYETELFRSVGRAYLVIQNQKTCLINDQKNFDINDLQLILGDFKEGLWEIIFNPNSISKGGVNKNNSTAYTDQSIDLLKDFANAVERISSNPVIQLIEVQKKMNSRLNRPVPRTFIEVASKGVMRQLTSRSFEENMDTAENRYIHYCLNKLLKLYSHANIAAINFKSRNYEKFQNEERQEKELNAQIKRGTKNINAEIFDNETRIIEADLLHLQAEIDKCVHLVDASESRAYRIKLTGKSEYDKFENHYFCKYINDVDVFEKYRKTVFVVLPPEFSKLKLYDYSAAIEFEIIGSFKTHGKQDSDKDKYLKLECLSISSVRLIAHPLIIEINKRHNKRKSLLENGWIDSLSAKEFSELKAEKEYFKAKISKLEIEYKSLDNFLVKIDPLLKKLKNLKNFYVYNKIKMNSTFPNNMVFVSNPYYFSARSNFIGLSNIDGFDDSIFSLLTNVDQIGLINISIIYERWCLLQIINTFVYVYKFEIQGRWQIYLLESILSNKYNIEFNLKAQYSDRELILTYEKQLPSGKRPDFVIDLFSKQVDRSRDSYQPNRLVLDAKFKDYLKGQKLNSLVHNLYELKDYSEGAVNQVFILHPTPDAIEEMSSPLEWGRSCDYGQLVDHKFGGVFLSPTRSNRGSLLNLQRLLGMFVQQSICVEEEKVGEREIIKHNVFCMSCGNNNPADFVLTNFNGFGGVSKFFARCNVCQLTLKKSYCFSCRSDLFKNGSKWTYHKTEALQITNVVCPQCQAKF